jgi:hypothetical protein
VGVYATAPPETRFWRGTAGWTEAHEPKRLQEPGNSVPFWTQIRIGSDSIPGSTWSVCTMAGEQPCLRVLFVSDLLEKVLCFSFKLDHTTRCGRVLHSSLAHAARLGSCSREIAAEVKRSSFWREVWEELTGFVSAAEYPSIPLVAPVRLLLTSRASFRAAVKCVLNTTCESCGTMTGLASPVSLQRLCAACNGGGTGVCGPGELVSAVQAEAAGMPRSSLADVPPCCSVEQIGVAAWGPKPAGRAANLYCLADVRDRAGRYSAARFRSAPLSLGPFSNLVLVGSCTTTPLQAPPRAPSSGF